MLFITLSSLSPIDHKAADWGGSKPIFTFEYDEKNAYLFSVTIQYYRFKAKKKLAFSSDEIREKAMAELNTYEIWDTKAEDLSHLDLASDKRAAIEKLLQEAADEEEEAAAAAAAVDNAKTV